MKVSINNKEVETDAVTLLQLTTELSLPAQGVAVAANNRMIPRTEWADYALSEGISIVIIKLPAADRLWKRFSSLHIIPKGILTSTPPAWLWKAVAAGYSYV